MRARRGSGCEGGPGRGRGCGSSKGRRRRRLPSGSTPGRRPGRAAGRAAHCPRSGPDCPRGRRTASAGRHRRRRGARWRPGRARRHGPRRNGAGTRGRGSAAASRRERSRRRTPCGHCGRRCGRSMSVPDVVRQGFRSVGGPRPAVLRQWGLRAGAHRFFTRADRSVIHRWATSVIESVNDDVRGPGLLSCGAAIFPQRRIGDLRPAWGLRRISPGARQRFERPPVIRSHQERVAPNPVSWVQT